ncbi:MAG: ATP-binding protein [Salinivirgaceae bacterium]|nr:ATP-binding protein [Salinivirgaceae bacterium]
MRNLNVNIRILIAITVNGLITLLLILIILFYKSKQEKLMTNLMQEQFKNEMITLLNLKQNTYKEVVYDYTYWDEFVSTIKNKDNEWYQSNISSILGSFHADYVCVYDTALNLIYEDGSPDLLSRNFITLETLKALQGKRFINYFQVLPEGTISINAASIHPTSDPTHSKTKPEGYLFVIKLWGDDFIDKLIPISGAKIKIIPPHDSIIESNPNYITVTHTLTSWDEEPVAQMHFSKEFRAIFVFRQMSLVIFITLMLSIIITWLLLYFITKHWVRKPLKLVSELLITEKHELIPELLKAPGEFKLIGNLFKLLFKQNKELQEAKEKAEENEKLKTAFLANMAHEIRTPMNGILGFSELLKNRNLSKQKQEEFLNIIEDSGNKLLYIINNLVDISKIEAGQMKVILEKTNLNEIIDYIYHFFGPKIEKYNMQLACSKGLAQDLAFVNTDHDKINAILINLVNNAIKYSQRGTITFGYRLKDSCIEFFVKDEGQGIEKNMQESIFERFIQVEKSIFKANEGSGLGLTISKSYVEMLGGKIWVESEPGKGSQFFFSIPCQS